MKRGIFFAGLVMLVAFRGSGQGFDAEQLLLDVQKLAELKQELQDLKEGYQVLDAEYSAIRDIAQGSFNLHKAFLDGLLAVSPAVRNYPRVTDIMRLQTALVSQYQSSWSWLRQKSGLRPEEIGLIGQIYSNLLAASVTDLSDLIDVLTDGTMRSSDAERLRQIDHIYKNMLEKAGSMYRFTNSTTLLALQRQGVLDENGTLQQLYGIKP